MMRRFIFIGCWLGVLFAGLNANLFALLLPEAIGEIAKSMDRTAISQYGSYVLSSFLLGWMVGGICLGYISDHYGRVKTMATAVALYALSTAVAALSESLWQLALCRFLTGVGIGGSMLGISIFLSESCPSRSRAVTLAILVTSYQMGVFLSALVAHLLPEWRLAFAFGALPLILAGLMLCYFQEPVQWVQCSEEPSKYNVKTILMGSTLFGSLLIGYWASLFWIPTWIQDLLGNAAEGHEKNLATMGHGVCAVIGCLAAGPLVDRFGRRPLIMAAFLGAFATSWIMFWGHPEFSSTLYFCNSLLGFFAGLAQAVMYIYLPELFPTKVRATSVGWCLNAGRLVTTLSVLFMGLFVSFFGGYREALSAFALIYLVGLCLARFIPETRMKENSEFN
jgi:MFS family permease